MLQHELKRTRTCGGIHLFFYTSSSTTIGHVTHGFHCGSSSSLQGYELLAVIFYQFLKTVAHFRPTKYAANYRSRNAKPNWPPTRLMRTRCETSFSFQHNNLVLEMLALTGSYRQLWGCETKYHNYENNATVTSYFSFHILLMLPPYIII